MVQNHQKGRTIFGVIAVIAVIALLCLLFIYICKSTHASSKANEIAEAVAARGRLYCPQIQINRPQIKSKKYAQNGPYGTTITLQNEQETPQPENGKLYFSIVVDAPSKSICKKLIKTDLFKADLITIDDDAYGQCPGIIRFYFTCPYELAPEDMTDSIPPSYDEPYIRPHFGFSNHRHHHQRERVKCKEPLPYEDKDGNCVECVTSSQCHETQECVENMCEDCPEYSTRTVRIGQRIGTRNCYCQEGYQLNTEQTKCVLDNNDWSIVQNCVGNNCSVCPEHATHAKGQRVGMTNCYCEDGYLPRQTGATQWQCAKVVILYPEPSNQIIVHDEKYPVPPAEPAEIVKKQPVKSRPVAIEPKPVRPAVTQPRPIRRPPLNPNPQPTFKNFNAPMGPVFMQDPGFIPFAPDAGWDIRAWESVEITIQ